MTVARDATESVLQRCGHYDNIRMTGTMDLLAAKEEVESLPAQSRRGKFEDEVSHRRSKALNLVTAVCSEERTIFRKARQCQISPFNSTQSSGIGSLAFNLRAFWNEHSHDEMHRSISEQHVFNRTERAVDVAIHSSILR